jgi:hypothetical protein
MAKQKAILTLFLIAATVTSGVYYTDRMLAFVCGTLVIILGILLHFFIVFLVDPQWEKSVVGVLNGEELETVRVRREYFTARGEVGLIALFNLTSWQSDFEADAYAARKTSDPETLIRAITKLGQGNFFHPPLEERVKHLKEI